MIFVAAALIAAATPPAISCPDVVTAEAFVCRAMEASSAGKHEDAAAAFEQAAVATPDTDPAKARMLAAAGNMWISAHQPGKAAFALDRALAGTSLVAEQRGEALLDRARAAEAQNDLKTARAKLNEAAATIAADPFYWYFSAAVAIREQDKAAAQSAINKALIIAPTDPTVLFEAGHVAQFLGDTVGARDYWNRAIRANPNSPSAQSAREAIALLPVPVTVSGAVAKEE